MSTELLAIEIRHDADVFTARQRGRAVAAVVGLELQDQVRVATALSETARELLGAGGGSALFRLAPARGCLEVLVSGPPSWRADPPAAQLGGLASAHRLMDAVQVERAPDGTVVRMCKRLPARRPPGLPDVGELRRELSRQSPPSPLEVLRVQNQDLLEALDELRAKQQELLAVNRELEETNRGVMAMYGQLSAELEETNRGVVALYAELDLRGQQLQRASEAKSRFLANVSHELRTPVNAVLGLCRLMLEPDTDPLTSDQTRQLGLVASSAETLLSLVNQLLDLAKAESGRVEVRPEPVDLGTLLAGLEAVFRPLVRTPAVELRVVAPAGLPPVETDPVLLRHVLGNLLSNALKFTECGTVTLAAAGQGAQVEVSVADTGIGIAPEHLDTVFEEFVQIPGPLQLESRGTGLGLPYARRLAEALGGTIAVTSRLGEGSVFSVRLPLRTPGAGAAGAEDAGGERGTAAAFAAHGAHAGAGGADGSAGAEREASGRGQAGAGREVAGTALVVDDDPAFRAALGGVLRGLAARVVEAADGREALALLERGVPDIVFLDLRMPHVGGLEVLRHMLWQPRLARVPVVLLSADERRAEAGELPPHARFLGKSQVTRARVREIMEALL